MAPLRSCAPCTRAIAVATFSRGADTLATAIAIGVKPAKKPMRKRATKSCCTEVTSPIAAMISVNAVSERISIILRPNRSDRRPNSGASNPDTVGVTAASTPDQSAMLAGSVTPSSRHVERQERREELEADERDEDRERQGPDVALPARGARHA